MSNLHHPTGLANSALPLRYYCRNLRCRSKLRNPVENPNRAFCCRGCHSSYFLKRCLVCENSKPGPDWKFCRRPKCRSRYRGNSGLYDWPSPQLGPSAKLIISNSKSAHFTGLKSGGLADQPWRIAAGPSMTAGAFYCATVDPPKIEARQAAQPAPKSSVVSADLNPVSLTPEQLQQLNDLLFQIPGDLSIPAFLKQGPRS
jgi:hypothetical protein